MVVAVLTCGTAVHAQDAAPAAGAASTVPVTTQSTVAAKAYEMGLVQREDRLFVDEGLEFFRQAVKADPQFALGHAALGYFTADPKEAKDESALALKYIANAAPDEQLRIHWINATKTAETVEAISALNDLLAKYPTDKRLANMAAEWLCADQGAFEPGGVIFVRLVKY